MPNQNSKKVGVLVAYTMPEMWETVKKTNKAVQANSAADADYIAFIRTGLKDKKGKRLPGIITHIAEVKKISSGKLTRDYLKEMPELVEVYEKKGWGWEGLYKEYQLEKIDELPNPISHKRGDRARSQVKFYTTMEELKKAKVLSDIKTLSQLEKMNKLPK